MLPVTQRRLWVVTLLIGIVALAVLVLAGIQTTQAAEAAKEQILAFDIAEDGTRFVFDETPVHDDGLPAYGGEFVTQGYLYPAGTLTCDASGCNGVLADGSPEFPDLVVGTWTCRGWHIADGAHTTTGPVVVTTQLYDLGDTPGAVTLVTDGYELVDQNLPFLRAITGGTGTYRSAAGAQRQTFLGWNPSNGVALSVEFRLSRR